LWLICATFQAQGKSVNISKTETVRAQQRQFRQDLKRQKRHGKDVEELIAAVELLVEILDL
jgi:hypothetical protein